LRIRDNGKAIDRKVLDRKVLDRKVLKEGAR
jgi:hypothetical protein